MRTYSNPRMKAVIQDWPSGAHRTTATFEVETHPTRGQRGTRTTIDPRTGRPGAAKVLTYAKRFRIVDGDDGRTYLIADNGSFGFFTVVRSDMKIHDETIWPKDSRYVDIAALFEATV